MRESLLHTPLFALDAVALDTETTGLDPKSARIVEVGGVVLRDAALREDNSFQRLVATGIPIPSIATAVHGIAEADLRDAPSFERAYADLVRFVGERPVIGHAVGFDLAVLKRECALSCIPFRAWSTLDTRLLAQLAAPNLPEFSLEAIAAWLGIAPAGRHRALADAVTAARVFAALLPHLRKIGIRTLGEAQAACGSLTRVLEDYSRAGWIEPGPDLPDADRQGVQRRLDSYPYRHRVRDLANPPAFIPPQSGMKDALAAMMEARISSLFVGDPQAPAARLGIVTERDLLRSLNQSGTAALDLPVGSIATRPLITVPEEAFLYRAIGRMRRFHIRHLAAVDDEDRVSGAVSARDLLRWRADAAIVLGDEVDSASDVADLARAWAKVPAMAGGLVAEAVGARDIAGIIARELGAITRHACELAERQLAEDGAGAPPCAYSMLVLGSAGRGESLLALDQDHAIIFAAGEPDGGEDRWFARLGERVADILDAVGLPRCSGGVMAGNAAFRGSLDTWRARVAQWINRARPEDLLNVDIFFDFRPVHGDGELAAGLWREAWRAARGSPPFLLLLTEAAQGHEAPIGLLGRLKTQEGRIDLKRHGLWPVVQATRVLALRHGVARRSTAERLDRLRALGIGPGELAAVDEAHQRFCELILKAQLADLAAGRPASNRVPLPLIEANGGITRLKADLRVTASLDEFARDHLAPPSGGDDHQG